MDTPIWCKRRWRPSQSGLESNASEPSDSKKSDSFDSSSDGSFNSGDVEDEEEEEEEKEEEEKEEMEYQAPDYPWKDSGDDSDTYAPQSPWVAHHQICSSLSSFFIFYFLLFFCLAIYWLKL